MEDDEIHQKHEAGNNGNFYFHVTAKKFMDKENKTDYINYGKLIEVITEG